MHNSKSRRWSGLQGNAPIISALSEQNATLPANTWMSKTLKRGDHIERSSESGQVMLAAAYDSCANPVPASCGSPKS